MSHTPLIFVGANFYVETVAPQGLSTIRVRYTQDPLAISNVGADDALNPANYLVSGPSLNAIVSTSAVYSDSQSIDLIMAGPLSAGVWSVTAAANVKQTNGNVIDNPRTRTFTISAGGVIEPASQGAVNEDCYEYLRKHMNPALRGPGWEALLTAIGVGECYNRANMALAFDQLFKISASEVYLTRRAGDDGVSRPKFLGMPDDLFRQLAIKTTNNQLTEEAFLEVLEIFYGADSVRANSTTAVSQPYALQTGDDLSILIDEQVLANIVFTAPEFSVIGAASAVEVAAAITRGIRLTGSVGYAVAVADPTTGDQVVRIYSPSLGLASGVRVVGGRAQNVLKFPDFIDVYTAAPPVVWTISFDTARRRLRYTNTDNKVDLSLVVVGDYVNVYGSTIATVNRGSRRIEAISDTWAGLVRTQYFEVSAEEGFDQVAVAVPLATDIVFFRPVRRTTHATSGRSVIVAQAGDSVDIVIPATSQAVGRGIHTGSYGQAREAADITALLRYEGLVTVTAPGHGLTIGSTAQVYIDDVMAQHGVPATFPGFAGILTGTSDRSVGSIWSNLVTSTAGAFRHLAIPLADGRGLQIQGRVVTGGVLGAVSTPQHLTSVTLPLIDHTRESTYTWATAVGGSGAHAAFSIVGPSNVVIGNRPMITGGISAVDAESNVVSTYNPLTNTTVAAASMVAARCAHAQTTLADDRILVSGGAGGVTAGTFNVSMASAERYTEGSGWAATGSMLEPRAQHRQILLNNGKVLAVGGRRMANGHRLESSTVALWRIDESGALSAAVDIGPNTLPLTATATTLVNPGESGRARAFSVGGSLKRPAPDVPIHDVLVGFPYCTIQGWFNDAGNTASGAIFSYSTAPLGSTATNTLLGFSIVGGRYQIYWHYGTNSLNGVTLSGVGSVAATATRTWNHFTVTKVVNGPNATVQLFINGLPVTLANPTVTNTTDGASSLWRLGESATPGFASFVGGAVDDVRISTGVRTQAQIYEDYRLATGELYYKELDRVGHVYNSCELYDPGTGTWSAAGSMQWARVEHRLIKLPDGRVMAIGGVGYDPSQPGLAAAPVRDCEIYDPDTNRWYPAGRLSYNHDSLIAEYLPAKNQIIVAGGTHTDATELFDVTSMTWRVGSARLPTKRAFAESARIADDVVLITGGLTVVSPGVTGDTSLLPNYLYLPNADQFTGAGLNGIQVATVVDTNTFTYETPDHPQYSVATSGLVTPIAAATGAFPGPFVWDPHAGLAVTGNATTISEELDANHKYDRITVADANVFPDAPGYIVFAFGRKNQVGPVKYLGRLSATQIALDYNFKFPVEILAGSTVTLLVNKGPFNPANAVDLGSFYATASANGRIEAIKTINRIAGAGVTINIDVVYPGDRGLGNEGYPESGQDKLTDIVSVHAGDDVDAEMTILREDV